MVEDRVPVVTFDGPAGRTLDWPRCAIRCRAGSLRPRSMGPHMATDAAAAEQTLGKSRGKSCCLVFSLEHASSLMS
jgi:hypothetical protein